MHRKAYDVAAKSRARNLWSPPLVTDDVTFVENNEANGFDQVRPHPEQQVGFLWRQNKYLTFSGEDLLDANRLGTADQ